MARSITPERQELRAEAIQLRQAGWSQPEISKALAVPQQTLSKWLIMGKNEINNTHSLSIMSRHSNIIVTHNNHRPIALYPCRYEEAAQHIEPRSREATIELVDSKTLACSCVTIVPLTFCK